MPRNSKNNYFFPYENLASEGLSFGSLEWQANLLDIEKELNETVDQRGTTKLANNLIIDSYVTPIGTLVGGQINSLAPAINPNDVCNYGQKPTTDSLEYQLNFFPEGSIIKFKNKNIPEGFTSAKDYFGIDELENHYLLLKKIDV